MNSNEDIGYLFEMINWETVKFESLIEFLSKMMAIVDKLQLRDYFISIMQKKLLKMMNATISNENASKYLLN